MLLDAPVSQLHSVGLAEMNQTLEIWQSDKRYRISLAPEGVLMGNIVGEFQPRTLAVQWHDYLQPLQGSPPPGVHVKKPLSRGANIWLGVALALVVLVVVLIMVALHGLSRGGRRKLRGRPRATQRDPHRSAAVGRAYPPIVSNVTKDDDQATGLIAYQGEPGANSNTACREMFPDMTPYACTTFEQAFNAVESGVADLAMIPVENSIAGRVADIHHLLPDSGLHIVGEYFLPIHFRCSAFRGASLEDVTTVRSHVHAFWQCRRFITDRGWSSAVADDTAGAAREVAEAGDPSIAALAPRRPRSCTDWMYSRRT